MSLSFAKSSLLFHSLLKRELQNKCKLGPVDSTVRYKVMKLCTGSVWDSNGWYLVALGQCKAVLVSTVGLGWYKAFLSIPDSTRSAEGIYAFIYSEIAGDLVR